MKNNIFIFALAMFTLATSLPAMAEQPQKIYPPPNLGDERYYLCAQDDDCVTANLPCGRVVVVNNVTHETVQGWYDHISPRYQCLGTILPQKAENIACVNNMCRADITQASKELSDTPLNRNPAYCEVAEDCAVVKGPCNKKVFVNRVYQKSLQEKYDRLRIVHMEGCFWPDNRIVKKVTCEQNTCGADLKIPNQNYWNKPLGHRTPSE